MISVVRFVIVWVALALVNRGAAAGAPGAEAAGLDGVWLAQSARVNQDSKLSAAWKSTFTVKDGAFAVSHFCGSSKELKGTLTPRPDVGPRAVDLTVEAIDMSELWEGVGYPRATLPGIYEREGDRLTICFQTGARRRRPGAFVSEDRNTLLLVLERAQAGFKEFPKEVTVRVRDADGKPAAGASVFQHMGRILGPKQPGWQFSQETKAGADGTVRAPYESLKGYVAMAHDPAREVIGFTAVSPALLQAGSVTVVLRPACALSGRVVCDELEKAGKSAGWRMAYLHYEGERVGYCATQTGDFEFPALPPGKYTIYAYGGSVGERYVDVEVPAGRAAVQMPPIEMDASPLVVLEGRPAPELEGVVGWKGRPVKLADLKGKVVLLDFWGYWCGPCVAEMPTIMALHERFKDRGLAIVGVHDDMHGEVDTAGALDQKLAKIRAEVWGGKDVPFPVALTSGEARDGKGVRIGAVAQYGIRYVPTTVVIDRQGKVVGTFEVADRENPEEVKKMNDRVEKLLGGGE